MRAGRADGAGQPTAPGIPSPALSADRETAMKTLLATALFASLSLPAAAQPSVAGSRFLSQHSCAWRPLAGNMDTAADMTRMGILQERSDDVSVIE